ncbi:hypothetical protein FACS1894200_13190 [Spirochaetia bacterium]|nr:hypothetical protein FACS1894200_13190 [Spirochaetia bacterium]
MGTTYAEITLRNAGDVTDARREYIKETEIRQITIQSLADTGAGTLVITESIQKELGLATVFLRESHVANGTKVMTMVAEPVMVCWEDRSMTCDPWVLPGADKVLLGAIPLEGMDLMVDPIHQRLVGVHGDKPVGMIY